MKGVLKLLVFDFLLFVAPVESAVIPGGIIICIAKVNVDVMS